MWSNLLHVYLHLKIDSLFPSIRKICWIDICVNHTKSYLQILVEVESNILNTCVMRCMSLQETRVLIKLKKEETRALRHKETTCMMSSRHD